QPVHVGLRVLGADVQHGQGVTGAGACVVGAPIDPAAAHEIAAALVPGHGEPTPLRPGPVPGRVDESTELANAHFGQRHGEAAVEADDALWALLVSRARLVLGRPHEIGRAHV